MRRITDESGVGLDDIEIHVWEEVEYGYGTNGETDFDGYYEVTGLPEGDWYRVKIIPKSHTSYAVI